MPESNTADSVVVDGFAGAGHIVYVHTKGMTNTMRKERGRNAGREDSFLGIPRSRPWGVRRLEDAKFLKAFYEGAMADKLYSVPMKTGFDNVERLLCVCESSRPKKTLY